MNLLDTSPERSRAAQIQSLQMAAQHLVDTARQYGMVVTISLESLQPPAMGNYQPIIDIREARNG